MPRLTKKISNPQNDVIALNENFDSIALDLADARGVFSQPIATGPVVIPTNTAHVFEINVLDVENTYNVGRLPAYLRWSMYVDYDGDGSWLWPLGGNITAVLLGTILVSVQQQYFTINPVANEKATITIALANFDAFDHTVYLYLDVFYQPGPDLGIAQRGANT